LLFASQQHTQLAIRPRSALFAAKFGFQPATLKNWSPDFRQRSACGAQLLVRR